MNSDMRRRGAIQALMVVFFLHVGVAAATAAQGGARPVALGGAYVAVAEDAHAVTWNPASIAVLEDSELTYSGTIAHRNAPILNESVSDDYVALVSPLSGRGPDEVGARGVLGFSYQHSVSASGTQQVRLVQPSLAYARRINAAMSLGVALTYSDYRVSLLAKSQSEQVVGVTVGALWDVTPMVSVGAAVYNVTEPDLDFFGVSNRLNRIVQAGVAIYPFSSLLLTCDIYDVFGATRNKSSNLAQSLNIGAEYYLTEIIALRAGAAHLLAGAEQIISYRAGIGLQQADYIGISPVNYYLDYAFVYWPYATTGFEDYTHHLGLAVRY